MKEDGGHMLSPSATVSRCTEYCPKLLLSKLLPCLVSVNSCIVCMTLSVAARA